MIFFGCTHCCRSLQFSSFKFSNAFVPAETVILCCIWEDFWPELPKSSLHFWPVMTSKMMHQICYSFLSIKKWSKLGRKIDFLAHFESFFCLRPCTPCEIHSKICQMKDLIKIYICSKFHQYSISGCEI